MNYLDSKAKDKYADILDSVFVLCFVVRAFAPHIRGPPHLNLIHSNSNDRRNHYGYSKKQREGAR